MSFYSGDPVRDADLHTAWQDRHYVPVCERCGNPLGDSAYHVVCYGEVCESCYDLLTDDEEGEDDDA